MRKAREVTRRRFSAEDKIRIVMEGMRGEDPISVLCRRERLHTTVYYRWFKVSRGVPKVIHQCFRPTVKASLFSRGHDRCPECCLGRITSRRNRPEGAEDCYHGLIDS